MIGYKPACSFALDNTHFPKSFLKTLFPWYWGKIWFLTWIWFGESLIRKARHKTSRIIDGCIQFYLGFPTIKIPPPLIQNLTVDWTKCRENLILKAKACTWGKKFQDCRRMYPILLLISTMKISLSFIQNLGALEVNAERTWKGKSLHMWDKSSRIADGYVQF